MHASDLCKEQKNPPDYDLGIQSEIIPSSVPERAARDPIQSQQDIFLHF